MDYKPIYLIGRDAREVAELAKTFLQGYNLTVLDAEDPSSIKANMSTVPSVTLCMAFLCPAKVLGSRNLQSTV